MNQHQLPSPQDIETAIGISPKARRKRGSKRFVWLVALAAVVAGLFYWYYTTVTTVAKINYSTQIAVTQDLIVSVTATGTVQPITQIDVGSEQSGIVKSVDVIDNAHVKKGDVLASLNTERLLAQRNRAAAQLTAAEARLQDAETTFKQQSQAHLRQKKLRNSGLSTDQDLESADAAELRAVSAIAIARADIQSAKADLSVVDNDLDKSKIISPIDGIVLKTSVKIGQTVAASLQAPVLFTLADDLAHIQIEAAVDEADIGAVATGQDASFVVDAYRARKFEAKVQQISFSPDKTDGVVTYKTILSAVNEDLALRPGMTTTARIVIQHLKQVLAVPNEALRYVPAVQKQSQGFSITQLFMPRFPRASKATKPTIEADGTRSLWVLRNDKPVSVKVKAGVSDGKFTAITSDELHDGDAVIVSAANDGP
jgi:HlyD family secretion protein